MRTALSVRDTFIERVPHQRSGARWNGYSCRTRLPVPIRGSGGYLGRGRTQVQMCEDLHQQPRQHR